MSLQGVHEKFGLGTGLAIMRLILRWMACAKVTEGVSGHTADFLLFSKERQLVQVVVSPYTYPTFVLSVAVVLLVVSC